MTATATNVPMAIMTIPSRIYPSDFLLNVRKNFGPAMSPTAVTNMEVPILETRENRPLVPDKVVPSASVVDWARNRTICFPPIVI